MKVVHKKANTEDNAAGREKGRMPEQEGNPDKGAAAFEKLVKDDPLNEAAYNRLMIIYRKNKDYKKELATIMKGMAAFEKSFKSSSKLPKTRKIATLSKSLSKSLGLTDKRGNMIHTREPLNRWSKRKLVVERMLKNKRKSS
jgi:hypothetical protein